MPIADRMKLAEGRPLRRRMMAAMAQQDCGQCGYNCNDYSDAIAGKSEARLNLCVPGGKETARMLKALYEEIEKAPAASSGRRRPRRRGSAGARGGARPIARQSGAGDIRLAPPAEQAGSEKETWHIDFDLSRLRPRLRRRRFLRHFCPQRSRPCRPDHCAARRVAYHEVSGKTLREVLTRRRLAGARAGHAVRTDLLSSPAARSARRRGRWRRARIPMAMPRRST